MQRGDNNVDCFIDNYLPGCSFWHRIQHNRGTGPCTFVRYQAARHLNIVGAGRSMLLHDTADTAWADIV